MDIDRETLIRAGIDPDGDPDDIARQQWVSDLLRCVAISACSQRDRYDWWRIFR